MSLRKIIFGILILVIMAGAFVFLTREKVEAPDLTNNLEQKFMGEIVTYLNSDGDQKLTVAFDLANQTAAIYPNEPGTVIFQATTSPDSFENSEQGLFLIKRDNEITLYLNDSVIFEGAEK